jgi:hypothetical protein
MYKKMKLFMLLFVSGALICTALASGQGKEASNEKLIVQQAQTPLTSVNESAYKNISNAAWSQFDEDFNYSSTILDEYVKKNISRREAMQSTLAIYSLTSQTAVNVNAVKPIPKYMTLHNETMTGLKDLRVYLWYLAKFFETNKPVYAKIANGYLNQSMNDRKLASEEFLLHFT